MVLLSVFDPDFALALRIYKQGISGSLCSDDTILYRQIVIGQTLDVPLSNLNITQIGLYFGR